MQKHKALCSCCSKNQVSELGAWRAGDRWQVQPAAPPHASIVPACSYRRYRETGIDMYINMSSWE